MADGDLLVYNIGELATMEGGVRRGDAMGDLAIRRAVAVLCENGRIREVGPSDAMWRRYRKDVQFHLNAGGRPASPGFVDAHTHAVFADDRVHEFELKLKGATYAEILKQGGGILHTVKLTRDATRAELLKGLMGRLDRMLEHGTTCVEVKSGYGLDKDTELRSLEVVREGDERHAMDLVPTFCGAHALIDEYESEDALIDFMIDEVLPEAAELAEFVDVFCEEGVFSVPASRRMLEAGRAAGLGVKVHADELARSGGSQLAADLQAVSADHLLHATEADATRFVETGVIPVLLPGTAFALNAPYADARMFIKAGAPVALATDCNPNCFTESMQFVMQLASYAMRMTPAEAWSAATINSAAAVGQENERGSIEPGKLADLVLWDVPTLAHVPYHFGVNHVWKVVKRGSVAIDRSERRI